MTTTEERDRPQGKSTSEDTSFNAAPPPRGRTLYRMQMGLPFRLFRTNFELERVFYDDYVKAEQHKADYFHKIEEAQGAAVFKYLLLIDVSALESYTSQTRLQAEQSFRLSRLVALFGFVLLLGAVTLGVVSQIILTKPLSAAYISGVAGILSEFIAGVFFYLYNATIKQINLFHGGLRASRDTTVALLLQSMVSDSAAKDTEMTHLARTLLTASVARPDRDAEGKTIMHRSSAGSKTTRRPPTQRPKPEQ